MSILLIWYHQSKLLWMLPHWVFAWQWSQDAWNCPQFSTQSTNFQSQSIVLVQVGGRNLTTSRSLDHSNSLTLNLLLFIIFSVVLSTFCTCIFLVYSFMFPTYYSEVICPTNNLSCYKIHSGHVWWVSFCCLLEETFTSLSLVFLSYLTLSIKARLLQPGAKYKWGREKWGVRSAQLW